MVRQMIEEWNMCRFGRLKSLLCLIAVGLLSGCDWAQDSNHLEEIRARGEIRVLTRNAPTSYYENADGQYVGLEHDMAVSFARHLDVKAVFIIKNTAAELLDALNRGDGDIIAAGMTVTEERETVYNFGPAYQQVEQQVICRRNNGPIPRTLDELQGKRLWISANTSYEHELIKRRQSFPGLVWESFVELDTEELLEMVWKREVDCTIADSSIFEINRRYYPELVLAFSLTEPESLSWIMPKTSHNLSKSINQWFQSFKESEQLAVIKERYYGFVDGNYDYVDTRRFHNAVKRKLPRYRQWFEEAATQYELDWMLLAAVSYQESHWNPRARSPTGVRGIMMITLVTAEQLELEDRLDPRASIFAGARYLSQLRSRIPEHIEEPQRTWMALAAYNMGFGHYRDARELTTRLGKDPDRWDHLESVLPLLSRKQHYKNLRHGYARGGQALHYVSKIRDYREQLSGFLFKPAVAQEEKEVQTE